MADLARAVVPGADEVPVSLLSDGKARTVVQTGQWALALEERQYEKGHGPCLEAAACGEIRMIRDARTETRWPDHTPDAVEQGPVSVPVPLTQQLSAALNVDGSGADAFDDESVELAVTFAAYAAVQSPTCTCGCVCGGVPDAPAQRGRRRRAAARPRMAPCSSRSSSATASTSGQLATANGSRSRRRRTSPTVATTRPAGSSGLRASRRASTCSRFAAGLCSAPLPSTAARNPCRPGPHLAEGA